MNAFDRLIEEAKKACRLGRGIAKAGFWCDAFIEYNYALGMIRGIQVFAKLGAFALSDSQKTGLLTLMAGISTEWKKAIRIGGDGQGENPYPVLQRSTLERMRRRIKAVMI